MTGRLSDKNQTLDSADKVEQKQGQTKKLHLPVVLGVILLGLVLLGFFHSALFPSEQEQTQNGYKVSGRIEGPEIHLGARLPGAVKSVNVKEGDSVHKGQLPIQMDDRDIAARSKAATSAVAAVQDVKSNAQHSL